MKRYVYETETIFSNYKSIYLHLAQQGKQSKQPAYEQRIDNNNYAVVKTKERMYEGRSMTSIDSVNKKIREYGYVNFEPVNEEWSFYCLEDKTIIKLKVIPLKFLKRNNDYVIESTVAVSVFSLPELRGESSTSPLPTTDSEKAKVSNKIDMKFDIVNEPWNEYALEDGIKISIKPIAVTISSTKLYDARGEPVYLVYHQSLVKKHPPTS